MFKGFSQYIVTMGLPATNISIYVPDMMLNIGKQHGKVFLRDFHEGILGMKGCLCRDFREGI